MDYDIIPTDDLYKMLLDSEENLAELKNIYNIHKSALASIRSAAINRKNGKGQMEFEEWNESKIKENWKEIIG